MPLQDVSNDQTTIDWLHNAGHGHLLDERTHVGNTTSSSPPPPPPPPPPLIPSNISYGPTTSSSNYPPQSTSITSSSPYFEGGYNTSVGHQIDALTRSGSFPRTDFNQSSGYGGPISPPPMMPPPMSNYNASPYNQQSSPLPFNASPTQFLAPNIHQQQLDIDIENMRRDPNTRVVQRPPQEDVVYKQRVFVRYLQPPTPPVGGTIIVREKQPPGPPPDPPIVIKRAPPPPPTPPPVIIRERPPPMPPMEGTTVIDKIIPAGPKPPRQVVIEQYPPLPPKPQDVIIERWLPAGPRQRRILYERLPPSIQQTAGRPIIVQYGPPHVRVQREVIATPGMQLPYQQVTGHTDINQILAQVGGTQQIHSTLSPSSLVHYNPYTTIQPSYGGLGQTQPNIVILQNGQQSTIPSSSYGMPLTCVCTPNPTVGLGAYGSGVSTIPNIGQSFGQSMVYNIPDNVPIDNILRQLGIDPYTIQRSTSFPSTDPRSAISHVWNAAAQTNLPYSLDPNSAVSHVWNAATHGNPPYPLDSSSTVSHVWNAAAHATDSMRPASPSVGRVWDQIEHYLHPQPNDAVRSVWDHIPHQSSPTNYPRPPVNYSPPPANYPPPNYPPPPPTNYPPPNYPPPPPTTYPPPNYPPPPPTNYPPPNYPPPPPTNYPPPKYPPPPPTNYPPPPNYPPPSSSSYPPSGGSSSAGAGVLSRLFGGGR